VNFPGFNGVMLSVIDDVPADSELNIALVGFLMVEPAHPGSSLRLNTDARIFLNLFQDLTALFFQWYATCPSTNS
jgi:hypothetical protein